MNRLTISDIARLSGVGKATVSRVINGTGYVSEKTRRKVKEVMHENTYHPSAAAQSLSKRVNNIVGIIIPEAYNPFFAEILSGISNVADENNMVLFFCNTDNKAEKDIRALEMMYQQRVTGLIMTPAMEYSNTEAGGDVRKNLSALVGIGTAVVLLDRTIPNFRCDAVYSNNIDGAFIGTEALIKAGHKKIGLVAGDTNMSHGEQRFVGFNKAMKEYGLPVLKKHIIYGEFQTDLTYQRTKEFLKKGDLPTAFFCCNNLSSAGFLCAVFEHGLRVPEDLAFVGFDKMDGFEILGYNYTCVARDVVGMGEAAMRLLLKRIQNPEKAIEQQILLPYLKKGGSDVFTGTQGHIRAD